MANHKNPPTRSPTGRGFEERTARRHAAAEGFEGWRDRGGREFVPAIKGLKLRQRGKDRGWTPIKGGRLRKYVEYFGFIKVHFEY